MALIPPARLPPLPLAAKRFFQWELGDITSWLILAAACLVGIEMLLFTAWVGDDAYISFRTVDNFINGYGLRWNVNERVQAYTNPLWMMLHIPFYYVWRKVFFLTLILSFACTLASVAIVVRTFPKSPATTAFCLVVPLIFSRPWVDFAVSGLENPLSYLLFACFGWVFFHADDKRRWFWLSIVTALALLNRLDTALIYFPPLVWLAWQERKTLPLRQIMLGFLPLVAWFAFSLFYYGFLWPNTAYAKLDTGIAVIDYWQQGWQYVYDLAVFHKPTCALLLAGIVLGTWCSRYAGTAKNALLFSLTLGIAAYGLYIVAVGGDFMSGRFFSLPVFIAVWMLYAFAPCSMPLAYGIGIVLALCALQLGNKTPYVWHNAGIADERLYYLDGSLIGKRDFAWHTHTRVPWVMVGHTWKNNPSAAPKVLSNVGMQAFFAGPALAGVDRFGLTDPLLARLPVKDPYDWRIGHFPRNIPEGYLHAIETGSTESMDKTLAKYYEKLHFITSGPLWSWERMETIVAFNLGVYDGWKDAYLKQSLHSLPLRDEK